MSKIFDDLFLAATKEGKSERETEREAQIEAMNSFNWYSHLDKDVIELQAFGNHVYKLVHDEVEVSNPLDLFYSFDSGGLDEEYQLQDTSGGRVYDWAYGTVRKRSPIKTEHWNILKHPRQMAMEFPIQKLQTGRILISDVIREAKRAILAHKVKIGTDALVSAYPTTSAYAVNANSTDITASVLKSALRPLGGLAEVRAIVGHETALWPIKELAGYDASTGYPESAKEELHKKGFLGTYLGAPIVRLKDYTDPYYQNTPIASTNIWVIPKMDKIWNVYLEYGSTENEPPQTDQETKMVTLFWYWEDGAGLPTSTNKLKYARRLYNCGVS